MKNLSQLFIQLSIFSVMVSCSPSTDDSDLSPEEIQLNLLSKTWSLGNVSYEGDNVTDRFGGFTITFSGSKSYTTTPERGDYDFEPFKSSGSWDFMDSNLNMLIRDDGVEMVISVSENTLRMNFMITESNGRLAGLGEYQFDLAAN
jgi:hypothetical protein